VSKLTKVYKWIKIGGLLSFIPFIMAAGPLGCYFLADYLEKKFGFPSFASAILVTLGFIASMREVIRIIKLALKTEESVDGKRD
jgi:hypothetical protein